MKKTNKGFTIVELVVVIAVVAVLAAVLIPTFTSIIKKANDSAYLQERQNQRIEDLAEKIDNQNYLTWDDFEGKIAEAIADAMPAGDHLTEEEVKTAIQSAIDEYSAAQANTRLTEEQVKKIVEKSLEGQVTMEQITALVNKAAAANPGVNVATVQSIVNQAIAGMSANPGLSAAQVSAMITSALQGQASSTEKTVAEAVATALAQYAANNPSLTAEQVATIVEEALAGQNTATSVQSKTDLVQDATAYTFVRSESNSLTVKYAFNSDSSFVLNNDITMEYCLVIPTGRNVTIDLNGHTLKVGDLTIDSNHTPGNQAVGIYVESGATLTILDSSESGTGKLENYEELFYLIWNYGDLYLMGGTARNDMYFPDVGITIPGDLTILNIDDGITYIGPNYKGNVNHINGNKTNIG